MNFSAAWRTSDGGLDGTDLHMRLGCASSDFQDGVLSSPQRDSAVLRLPIQAKYRFKHCCTHASYQAPGDPFPSFLTLSTSKLFQVYYQLTSSVQADHHDAPQTLRVQGFYHTALSIIQVTPSRLPRIFIEPVQAYYCGK